MTEPLSDRLERLDEWCVKRCAAISEQTTPHITDGGNLDDPQYRHWLGQHTAYMAMRSYLHGSIAALRKDGK